MPMRCVVIDDHDGLEPMKEFIEQTPSLQLIEVFDDASSAAVLLAKQPVDLVFTDMQMMADSGAGLASLNINKPMIIFTAKHKRLSIEGFEVQAVDCLIKPVGFERFARAVAKAEAYYKFSIAAAADNQYLYVYSKYRLVKIDLRDIEFIESLDDYVRIHITDGEPVLSLMPLKRVLQKLPRAKFQRVHRSYIVAVDKIKGVSNRRVILAAATVPISDAYLDEVKKIGKA